MICIISRQTTVKNVFERERGWDSYDRVQQRSRPNTPLLFPSLPSLLILWKFHDILVRIRLQNSTRYSLPSSNIRWRDGIVHYRNRRKLSRLFDYIDSASPRVKRPTHGPILSRIHDRSYTRIRIKTITSFFPILPIFKILQKFEEKRMPSIDQHSRVRDRWKLGTAKQGWGFVCRPLKRDKSRGKHLSSGVEIPGAYRFPRKYCPSLP